MAFTLQIMGAPSLVIPNGQTNKPSFFAGPTNEHTSIYYVQISFLQQLIFRNRSLSEHKLKVFKQDLHINSIL